MTSQPFSSLVERRLALAPRREPGVWRAVLLGGLTVGVLDIVDAIVFFGLHLGVSPIRIFQSVAAGVLGREAARAGGVPTAILGGALHVFIATTIVAIYVLVSRRWALLTRRAIACGLAYGVACYFVMSFVVVPLSAAGRGLAWPELPVLLNGVVGHALLVGLPAALFARRAGGPARDVGGSARE
jgi:hypothetical protein